VPLVVVPGSEEKPDVAARVTWTGTGVVLNRRKLSEAGLRGAVTTVLKDERYRRRAGALSREYQSFDAPRRAADLIETLTDSHHQISTGGFAQ
jgi:UDP:flavonoid glycosyltransferase YjiC (YdhE family)